MSEGARALYELSEVPQQEPASVVIAIKEIKKKLKHDDKTLSIFSLSASSWSNTCQKKKSRKNIIFR